MLFRGLKGGRDFASEVVPVVLAAKRALDVLQRLGVIAPRKRDAFDLQRSAVRDRPSSPLRIPARRPGTWRR